MATYEENKKTIRNRLGSGTKHGINMLLEDLEELDGDEDSMDMLIENIDELRAAVIQTITSMGWELSRANQFASEEVLSTFTYPSGYTEPKSLTEQFSILRQLFPELTGEDEVLATIALPKGAEGWFAIPRWQKLAPMYNQAVQIVLTKIAASRKLYNYREGALGSDQLRQSERKIRMMEQFGEVQKSFDILIIPAQFGLRHRGRSVRRAREVMRKGEFGLGAFEVGIMLLTHPERLVRWVQLHVDCPGDEYDFPDSDVLFGGAPYFSFSVGEVGFDTRHVSVVGGRYGSASGFLPQ